ncbi:MAG: hypothetical protein QOE28_2771, partial [Solirubrobacteraceae bacterium]|nr:hypothetical protein [Solirubrobacteraceae bacterium]
TPAYMAPEQALNAPLGPYTDLYALGVMAFELLAGRPPFEADTAVGVLYRHVHAEVPRLETLAPDVPAPFGDWVHRLLAKDPAQRPQSAAEAWESLEEIAVAELGPYWRRSAGIAAPPDVASDDHAGARASTETAREEPTVPFADPAPAAVPAPPGRRGRRRARAAVAATLLAAGAGAVVIAASGGSPPAPSATHPPARAALAYDFAGDGRQQLVLGMPNASPRGETTKSGVVLIHGRHGWTLVTERSAGLPGRPREGDNFGSALVSGDFDRDGRADLAIGTPGRQRVSVLYGSAGGLLAGRRQQLRAADARLPAGSGRYGYQLLATDFDGDGRSELVVGAPGPRPGIPGTGALQILFGGPGGLDVSRSRVIPRPQASMATFAWLLRAGDVNGDGHPDLVEGAPPWRDTPGHGSYCPGTDRGPVRCREFMGPDGTAGLEVADVNGDGRGDVLEGVSQNHTPPQAGEVRIWLGTRQGPHDPPTVINQDSPSVPGVGEPGDGFGSPVLAADLDGDGYADMIVGSPGENAGAGRVTIIRGGRKGYATAANAAFDQDLPAVPGRATPGAQFGSTATVLQLSGDARPDVAIAARGGTGTDERVVTIEGGHGVFVPDETSARTLPGIAALVHAPRGGRIRLGRAPGA